ncbi:MAG TPA: hypothetical protein VKO43_04630 [Candidatus Krumholzibacteriaceae bacterium]|nr:hypothetical protein [Candidatus Krumholzibacteriaceae bacterium]
MKDRSKTTEQLYNRKLLDLEPEMRLAMACRMFSAARELVSAGISAGGEIPASEVRAIMFLRLYGRDFTQAECTRILSRIKGT